MPDTCKHIIALGYLNYFDEQDDNKSLLSILDIQAIQDRFMDVEGLIITRFDYCSNCGKKLNNGS